MLVIGLNQTIDRTIRLPALAPGEVLRATDAAPTPGGKAVNVCRAALTLGAPAQLVGPFPGRFGHLAVELLTGEGLRVTAVPVAGELRGTTVVIEVDGRTTVINEPGPDLSAADWDAVLAAVASALVDEHVIAISGSAPPGAPDDAHGQLVGIAHDRGATVAVDVTGRRLLDAATAGADLVSPNLAEVEQALGTANTSGGGEAVDLDTLDPADVVTRSRAAAAALLDAGARAAMVSAGRHGVACRSPDVDAFVRAPDVAVVNPIGAGDALLGATLVALERGLPLDVAVRAGVAYAAASVAHPVAGYADPRTVETLTTAMAELAEEGAR